MLIFRERISVIAALLTLLIFFQYVAANVRDKRFLTFPRTSPTRLQLIMGIGIPVDLEIESVTIGYVLKVEYFLPENASNYINFLGDPFDLTTRPIGAFFVRRRRGLPSDTALLEEPEPTEAPVASKGLGDDGHSKRQESASSTPDSVNATGFDSVLNQKFERYVVPVEEVESGTNAPPPPPPSQSYASPQWDLADDMSEADYWNQEDKAEWFNDALRPKQPQNLDASRWIVYKGIAALAASKGLDGRACVLRSICESAHTSFDYSNGILGELMHIVMSPSTTRDELSDHSDNEYLRAEELGQHGAPCDKIFKECSISILNQFSGIYTPMMDVINMLG